MKLLPVMPINSQKTQQSKKEQNFGLIKIDLDNVPVELKAKRLETAIKKLEKFGKNILSVVEYLKDMHENYSSIITANMLEGLYATGDELSSIQTISCVCKSEFSSELLNKIRDKNNLITVKFPYKKKDTILIE